MVTVYIRNKESLEDALKRFSKLVEKEGITTKVKENMFYTKPSKVRRDKVAKAKRKLEKKRRKELVK
ncbi:MAG: 30S ribosomal protein S21 [Spirochaetes bacterium]|nr:30S ribosomal protein S21 [Spirochaetota bacterium]